MNEIVKTEGAAPAPAKRTWKVTLEEAMPSIAAGLPRHITPDKFRQVAATAIGSTPDLLDCMHKNPRAVLTALANCAKDGLLPDNREAALVAFKGNLTYIPMISGVLKRMRNSGEVASISSAIIYANDTVDYVQGDDEKLVHKPKWDGDRGEAVAAYAIIKLTSGETYREVMSKKEIMAVKNASRAKGGPWSGPFELEMWRKTVLKRAAKYCPLSDERIRDMLDRDNDLYDLDAVRAPQPSMRDAFRAAPAIPYTQARAEAHDPDTGEIIDADVVRDINEDIEDTDPGETPSQPGEDAGEDSPVQASQADALPEQSPEPASGDASAAQSEPEQDEGAKRFYAATMKEIRAATTAGQREAALKGAKANGYWDLLTDAQRAAINKAGG